MTGSTPYDTLLDQVCYAIDEVQPSVKVEVLPRVLGHLGSSRMRFDPISLDDGADGGSGETEVKSDSTERPIRLRGDGMEDSRLLLWGDEWTACHDQGC